MAIWLTPEQDRATFKRESASAHIAWGALVTIVASEYIPVGFAMMCGYALGCLWEFGWWLVTDKSNWRNRMSWRGICTFTMGWCLASAWLWFVR